MEAGAIGAAQGDSSHSPSCSMIDALLFGKDPTYWRMLNVTSDQAFKSVLSTALEGYVIALTDSSLLVNILSLRYEHMYMYARRFSDDYIDFVMRCLYVDPSRRDTAAGLLSHPFLHRCLPELYGNTEHTNMEVCPTGSLHVPRLRRESGSAAFVAPKHPDHCENGLIQKITDW